MTLVVSSSSQSHLDNVKPENWSNSFIRSSSWAESLIGSLVAEQFSFGVILSITSFIVASGDFRHVCWLSDLLLKLYFHLFF